MKYGFNNGIACELIAGFVTFASNTMLVDCFTFLPMKLLKNANLTYGQVVGYILDEREIRVNPKRNSP